MSLLTPFGPLKDIPLDDVDQLKEILVRSDKSRMLEGLVIEAVFNDYLSKLSGQGIEVLPISLVRTLTVKSQPNSRQKYVNSWWVWDRSKNGRAATELRVLLAPRSPEEFLFDCYYNEAERDFFMEWGGIQNIPIQSYMLEKRGQSEPQFRIPSESVIDEHRSQQAFWAGISSQYSDDRLFRNVVLYRLFKNCAIQPFFDGVWDIDSLAQLPDGKLIQLEVKHKYPRVERSNGNLSFGINNGQLSVMLDLAQRGIKTLHMIMVKPIWSKDYGTGYLLNRIGDRKNVLFLAKLLDENTLRQIQSRQPYQTGEEQSFTGTTGQKARYVDVSEFQFLGTLDDPVEYVARNISLAATGALNRPASDRLLKENRIQGAP